MSSQDSKAEYRCVSILRRVYRKLLNLESLSLVRNDPILTNLE
jgi:hypothetical protein